MQYTCPNCDMVGANGLGYYEASKVPPLCHVCKNDEGKSYIYMVPSDDLRKTRERVLARWRSSHLYRPGKYDTLEKTAR